MKLIELIEEVRAEKPNSFGIDTLIRYVNEVEAIVCEFAGKDPSEWVVHKWTEDGNVYGDDELFVDAPYSVLYKSYLKAKIDFATEDYESYANNQAQFNLDLEDWQAYAVRNGIAKSFLPKTIRNWW